MSPKSWHVYLVTDRFYSKGRSTLEIVEAAVAGGISAVQLREKDLETCDFYREGMRIRDFLRARKIPLIINDRIDIALALKADGVHLGQSDMPPEIARKILGPKSIIGLSVTKLEHINEKLAGVVDYLGISPLFLTSTKPDAGREWGLAGLQKARQSTDLPLVAIGSIKFTNAAEVIRAGADSVAVVTAIVSADDPEQATKVLMNEVLRTKGRKSSLI
jgi:thiamine-phosphate pyrophosphorylase